jgi:ketosteroid isomerase-like protein
MTTLDAEFTALEDAFNGAMISNDVDRIAACISDDWVLITPEVGPVSREGMLAAIASGTLTHQTMNKKISMVRVYGDTAIVSGRGQNTGTFRGDAISADEWETDIYHKIDGRWLCVLTHLTPVKQG